MPLSEEHMTALRNLARKQAGHDVDWINIGDARALTELGLAERTREGWRITPAGERELTPQGETQGEVTAFADHRPGHTPGSTS